MIMHYKEKKDYPSKNKFKEKNLNVAAKTGK